MTTTDCASAWKVNESTDTIKSNALNEAMVSSENANLKELETLSDLQ